MFAASIRLDLAAVSGFCDTVKSPARELVNVGHGRRRLVLLAFHLLAGFASLGCYFHGASSRLNCYVLIMRHYDTLQKVY
jgi:hypothetical protein